VDEALKDQPTGDAFLDATYDEFTRRVGVTRHYYRLIYLLAQSVQPSVYVELGVDDGIAIAHAASGCPGCRCIGIDPWIDWPGQYEKAKAIQFQYPNVEFVRGWSTPEARAEWLEGRGAPSVLSQTVNVLPRVPGQIDMLFIDAWHRKDLALREWEVYGARVPKGGVVLCDDIFTSAMGGFWEIVSEGRSSRIIGVPYRPQGIGVIIK